MWAQFLFTISGSPTDARTHTRTWTCTCTHVSSNPSKMGWIATCDITSCHCSDTSLMHFRILSFIDPLTVQQRVYKTSYLLSINKMITDLLRESSTKSWMIWWWQSAIIWSIEKELSEREIKTLLSGRGEGVIRLREADTRIQQEVISAVHSSVRHVTEPRSHVNRLFIFPASLIQSQTGRHLDTQLGTF